MNLFEAHAILNIKSEGYDGEVHRKGVEKAYRKQALRLHPDRGGDASLFRQLQAAKEVALQQFGSSLLRPCYVMNNSAVEEILHKDRTCVRQVEADPIRDRIIVATDDGLWLLTKNAGEAEWKVLSFEDDTNFLCCSIVGDMVYAGGKRGQLFWLDLQTLDHGTISTPYPESNLVSMSASLQGWTTLVTSKQEIIVLLNLNDTAGQPNMMLAWKSGLQTLCPESIILEASEDEEHLFLWVGGSRPNSNSGQLMLWKLETSELYGELVDMDSAWQLDDEDDDDWDSDSDAPSSASKDPIIIQSIEEGPVYSIDKHGQTVAAVVGQTVLVWEFWSSNGACLIPIKTLSLPGDYQETLYTVSLSDDFLVSAGLGECLFVWTTDTWDLVHTVSVARTKESCLATCCVMTSNWMPNEKGVLACGGYDGCISLWRLAHRLESEG